jgi:aminopeptidase N
MKYILASLLWINTAFLAVSQEPMCKEHGLPIEMEQNSFIRHSEANKVSVGGSYDLKYHRLEWKLDPAEHFIEGAVTSYFIASQENVTEVEFDLLNNMRILSVDRNGQPLSYTHEQDILKIELIAPLPKGQLDSVRIQYEGAPQSQGFGAFETSSHNGVPVLWTLSEPYGAKSWWPCKQDLNDKIDSIDIWVTLPENYKVGTNGVLIKTDSLAENQVVYHWKHRYPIPAYLISLAITNYAAFEDFAQTNSGDSVLILNYVYPEQLAQAKDQLAATVEQMELFNQLFGDYPFKNEKYGHAQFGWGGGMEHQTMSSMGSFSYSLQAHELAHQWFGDKVTCGSWQDIWLNEGFATYLTALTYEFLTPDAGDWDNWKSYNRNYICSSPDGSTYVYDTSSVSRIFNSRLSYRKGAYILHMLRGMLGDTSFFEACRNYLNDPSLAYGYARTEDLQAHLESSYGFPLNEFFEDWLYGEGYPSYHMAYRIDGRDIWVRLDQEQSHASVDFFEAKVPIVLSDGLHYDTLILDHQYSGQEFEIRLSFEPNSVQFDPEQWILSAENSQEQLTATSELELSSPFLLYPNPVENDLMIQWQTPIQKGRYQINSLSGKELLSGLCTGSFCQIDVRNLPKGHYVLWLEFDGYSAQKLLIHL